MSMEKFQKQKNVLAGNDIEPSALVVRPAVHPYQPYFLNSLFLQNTSRLCYAII